MDLIWLWAALIGVGGSAVGGLIGGWYVLRATALNFRDLCLFVSGSPVPGNESATG